MSPAKMIKLTLNGTEIEAPEGRNLVDVCKAQGIDIPHFCYHPGLKVEGNCRMCMIEVEGVPKPQIACATPAREGMKVQTHTPKLLEVRKSVLEFLLVNHPIDCPICDQAGECYLQNYYMLHGKYVSRLEEDKVEKRKVVDLGPLVVLDTERCVLCSRCVRFCRDVAGNEELYIRNRGDHAEITTFPGRVLENAYSGNVVDICPVGALTSKDFRFKCRVWYLETTNSICPGCSRGCNTYVEHNANIIQRLRPRENVEVNGWWMCDAGRLGYHAVHEERLLGGWVRGKGERGARDAFAEFVAVLRAAPPSEIGFIASPDLTTESLFALKRFAALFPGARVAGGSLRAPWIDDGILRKLDAHPNTMGLQLLGLGGGLPSLLAAPPRLLVVFQEDLAAEGDDAVRAALGRVESLLVIGTHSTPTVEMSRAALPIPTYAEQTGTFINFAGRLQRFEKAIQPLGESGTLPALLAELAQALGRDIGWTADAVSPESLWREIAEESPAFQGIAFESIPANGVALDVQGAGDGAGAGAARGTSGGPSARDAEPIKGGGGGGS
jgi:NADH-quinone oxidoreductase subunit G